MKQILIILGLFASVTTFAQSPRIKLNQITKDTVKGSVLISSASDSGMVYSRDFYIAYGADTLLILYGDTIGGVGGGFASVLSDGLTITGDGTTGNELKVDTATVISTIKGLVDTLTARGYLTTNETITLSGDVTGSGTTAITATVVDDSHNHIISNVDFLQDSLTAKANASELSNYLLTSNYIVDSTRINATGDTAFYYQNGVEIGSQSIAGGGGTTYNNISETADTVYIAKYLDVDTSTLYVDADLNKVGIGTSSPQGFFSVERQFPSATTLGLTVSDPRYEGVFQIKTSSSSSFLPAFEGYGGVENATLPIGLLVQGSVDTSKDVSHATQALINFQGREYDNFPTGAGPVENAPILTVKNYSTLLMKVEANGNVGIGTSSPAQKLDVNGKVKIQDLTGTGGNAVYENGGVLGVASDARFKTYVGDIQNGIALINQLKPKYFIDNRNSSFQQLGFYAQEVKSVINEASYPIGNTDYLGINDRAILAITVKAIQEQQAIIETIQTELNAKSLIIESQASEIDQLKTLITDLTNRLIILENK